MTKVLLDADYAIVSVNQQESLGMIIWMGVCTLDEYTKCFNLLLDFQQSHTVKYFLSDIRKQGVINPQARQWFQKEAIPRAVSQGLLKGAIVMDGNIFKRYYINMILQATSKAGLAMKTFDSEDKAREWLFE